MPVELDYWAEKLQRAYTERDHKKEYVLKAPTKKEHSQSKKNNAFSIFKSD
ncbi:MAG: hypothetical protein KAJ76_11205 [Candidatus Heimdallarchaeota archaeon]|nr:hypothetical protein [Candidatus Heimdallarchaeota archaeon]